MIVSECRYTSSIRSLPILVDFWGVLFLLRKNLLIKNKIFT
nr:MAG TPA: hypothetical protein [Caudoviricetes sp.]